MPWSLLQLLCKRLSIASAVTIAGMPVGKAVQTRVLMSFSVVGFDSRWVFAVQVMLRVLDVGAVRVITSVLAQSAALKFYET
jgi:hypothetical protein